MDATGADSRIAFNYFFSRQAREYLSSLKSLDVSADDLERARDFSLRLISRASSKVPFVSWPAHGDAELRSIALCRMLLAASSNAYAARLFGEGLAKLCCHRLLSESAESRISLLSQLYPSLSREENGYSLALADYLSGPNELVYAALENGRVTVDEDRLIDMTRLLLSTRASDLSAIDRKAIPKMAADYAPDFSEALPKPVASALDNFKGKWLNQPCLRKILAGVGEGRRYYGSMAIAIACQKDGLSKSEATAVMQQYVSNCSRTSHEFREGEALATLEWVYRHPGINLSCKMMLQQGLIDKFCDDCPQVRGRRPSGPAFRA